MSVNGGFATKQLETQYNTLVYNLLYLMQYRIRKLYNNQSFNEINFKHVLLKSYKKTLKMEEQKYIQPKFSEAIKDLIQIISRSATSTLASN